VGQSKGEITLKLWVKIMNLEIKKMCLSNRRQNSIYFKADTRFNANKSQQEITF
jgi:hypothetical protein